MAIIEDKNKIYLPEPLSYFREALLDEISEIEKNGQSTTILKNGRTIRSEIDNFWYLFDVQYIPDLPAETPGKLKIGRESFNVVVVSYNADESSLIIKSSVKLPPALAEVQLENGSAELMKRQIECIENNVTVDNPLGTKLLPDPYGDNTVDVVVEYSDLDIPEKSFNERQREAIKSALQRNITYIWGPPGTGKTQVIGQIIVNLAQKGRSVLITSHTNTAVDGAIKRTCECMDDELNDTARFPVYPILRLGNVDRNECDERVTLDWHVEVLARDLKDKKEVIENALNQLKYVKWYQGTETASSKEVIQKNNTFQIQIKEKSLFINQAKQIIYKKIAQTPNLQKYEQYKDALAAYEEKRAEHENKISGMEDRMRNLTLSIDMAREEIRKHEEYEELAEQIKGYNSEDYYESEVIRLNTLISAGVRENEEAKIQLSKNQDIIDSYSSKSSVGKFFTNKNNVSIAQENVVKYARIIEESNSVLKANNVQLQEVKNKYSEVRYIHERMSQFNLTGTEVEWRQKEKERQAKKNEVNRQIHELKEQEHELYENIMRFEQVIKELDEEYSLINELKNKIEICKREIASLEKSIITNSNTIKSIVNEYLVLYPDQSHYLLSELRDSILNTQTDLESLINGIEDLRLLCVEQAKNDKIDSLLDDLEQTDRLINDLNTQSSEIEEQLQKVEEQAILDAQIVGTTLTNTYLNETLRKRKFDTVIIDEASMASIPALWCAAFLAEKNIVIVGDFLQISPILLSGKDNKNQDDLSHNPKYWLGTDIFRLKNLDKKARRDISETEKPENFIMLNVQYRMEKNIARIVNKLYYGDFGGLESISYEGNRKNERDSFYSWYRTTTNQNGPFVHLIDTASLNAWVTSVPQGEKYSRMNYYSAAVCVDLAMRMIQHKQYNETCKKADVIIIAPYRPHVKWINKLIESTSKTKRIPSGAIKAGTIHSFQGSQAPIVIMDTVIDAPQWRANLFMPDDIAGEELKRMFNVAVTRAQYQLFVVGNFDYCLKYAKDNSFAKFIKTIKDSTLPSDIVDARALLPHLTFASEINGSVDIDEKNTRMFTESNYDSYFLPDVQQALTNITIFSAFMAERRIGKVLPYLSDAINRGVEIIVVTKEISERGKRETESYQKCEKALKQHGIEVIHKKGMHEKLVFIDNRITYHGSLNALSFNGSTTEFTYRTVSEEITVTARKFQNLDTIGNALHSENEMKCPICGKEMILNDGRYGQYWQCSDSKCYSRGIDEKYAYDGLLRCSKCGGDYKFYMKEKPRWQCVRNKNHYKYIKEADLQLPKMLALIPADSKSEVYMKLSGDENMDIIKKDDNKKRIEHNAEKHLHNMNTVIQKNNNNKYSSGRSIRQEDDNGNVINRYDSIRQAVRMTGINSKSIRDAASGVQKHAGGYVWKYDDY